MSKRLLEDPKSLQPANKPSEPSQSSPPAAVLEAYKKHAEELRGIEDRQNKTIALVLGIFSAAGTLLIKGSVDLDCGPKAYITLVALVIVGIGQHATNELHDLRVAARDMLVRCETALRFYEVGAFLQGKMLYTDYERSYPTRGDWMKEAYWFVWLVLGGFLLLLWFGKHITGVL